MLGSGIVPGSVILIAGEPGIGKSTLMLQIGLTLKHKILYVSGEESEQQIKMRADRMSSTLNENCFILSETSTQNIFKQAEDLEPELMIVDSIQTLHSNQVESSAGSVSQVRQATGGLIR